MAGEEGEGRGEKARKDLMVGWRVKLEDQWLKVREHAETYPYVWASYIVVYGGLGAYLAYRWRKLRRTEDRVRALQSRLRELVEAEGPPSSSSSSAAAGGGGTAASSPPPRPPAVPERSSGQR